MKTKISGYAKGTTGDIAADHYHKYKEDAKLMAEMGLDAYRFSISWSRLIPNGRGPLNPKGLEFYNNLVNELVNHGIQPHATLNNYDLPQALEDEYGGWIDPRIVKDFTAYADVCFREFGDRVSYWITVNEPNVFAVGGYDQGLSPPSHCSPPFGTNCNRGNSSTEPYIAVHNILLAHASATRLYRKKISRKAAWIHRHKHLYNWGFPFYKLIPRCNSNSKNERLLYWIANPLVFGDYPDAMKKIVGARMPSFNDHESQLVRGAFDFLGVIHYSTAKIQDGPGNLELEQRDFNMDIAAAISNYDDFFKASEWPILSWGLQGVLEYLKLAYANPPIYIVENGQRIPRNSNLEDTSKVKYMQAYIGSVLDAIRNGSDTRGYFVWSFLDLFELLDGYESSYGLYYVDFDDPDLKRYPKLSGHWYSRFLKGASVSPNGVIQFHKNYSAHFFQ
ncbi:hypothetical protein PTKIN_Ptkin15bG0085300 [Pterospermum kingtungense]